MALYLTRKQEARLETVFFTFYEYALDCPLPIFQDTKFRMLMYGIKSSIEAGISLTPEEVACLVFVLEWYFMAMDDEQVDPLAEQAYHKLTGYWPPFFSEPWYDRVKTYRDKV